MLKALLLVFGLLVKGQFARQSSEDTSKFWPSANLLQPISNPCVDQDLFTSLIQNPVSLSKLVKEYLDKAGFTAGKQFIDELIEYNQNNIKYMGDTRPLQSMPINNLWPPFSKDEVTQKILHSFERHHHSNHYREKIDTKSILPVGALVRISAHNKVKSVRISITPMMSVMDAIIQAELKLKLRLGEDLQKDFITFTHHSTFDCNVIKSIGPLTISDTRLWNIEITDESGSNIYSGTCIPADSEIVVKPATIIELNYTV